jgi:glycosyltransferase involved in cell wall biosynthesis
MHILRVCYEYPPPWDGLTPGPYELSRAQAEAGHDIVFLAGGKKTAPYAEAPGIQVERLGRGLPTYLFGPFLSFDLKLIFRIRKILKKRPIDVIHFHGNTALWFSVLRLLGFFKSVPYVFHAHSTSLGNLKAYWRKADARTKIKALFIWTMLMIQDFLTIKAADAVITVSAKDRDIFVQCYKCPERKILVIENGVNTGLFVPSMKASREGLRIILAAYLQPRKNLEKLFSVLRVLNKQGISPHLTIVGRGEAGYISKLKILAKKLEIDSRITWKGYVPYPELPGVYAEHDILLLFSHSEGLPKIVLEALSCGLRVVSTRSFAVTGYLNEIVAWVDEEDDEEKIANAVLQTWEKAIDWDRFKIEYSWKKKAGEIDRIYRRLIEKRPDAR